MPGNQSGSSGEFELKVSCMVKRSQGKSTLGATNFKKRVFVLTNSRLAYYDGNLEVSEVDVGCMRCSQLVVACLRWGLGTRTETNLFLCTSVFVVKTVGM